jgi:hypothetical protein
VRWRRNPLHIPVEERGLPTDKSRTTGNGEGGSGFAHRDTVPPFGTGARVLIAILALALIGFFIARGTYVVAALMLGGLVANEILLRRRYGG